MKKLSRSNPRPLRIAFFGDSLTEGFTGASYIDLLKNEFPDETLLNYGKGGDTVISLLKRLEKLPFNAPFDISFLWIGINDILVKTSWVYPIIKTLRGQPWARNFEDFGNHYRKLARLLLPRTDLLITVSPLVIGEDLNNSWNNELRKLDSIITQTSDEHDSCIHLDLRKFFLAQLHSANTSSSAPKSFLRPMKDAAVSKKKDSVAAESSGRGLSLTLDGVHLNEAGAALVAQSFANAIKKISRDRFPSGRNPRDGQQNPHRKTGG